MDVVDGARLHRGDLRFYAAPAGEDGPGRAAVTGVAGPAGARVLVIDGAAR